MIKVKELGLKPTLQKEFDLVLRKTILWGETLDTNCYQCFNVLKLRKLSVQFLLDCWPTSLWFVPWANSVSIMLSINVMIISVYSHFTHFGGWEDERYWLGRLLEDFNYVLQYLYNVQEERAISVVYSYDIKITWISFWLRNNILKDVDVLVLHLEADSF